MRKDRVRNDNREAGEAADPLRRPRVRDKVPDLLPVTAVVRAADRHHRDPQHRLENQRQRHPPEKALRRLHRGRRRHPLGPHTPITASTAAKRRGPSCPRMPWKEKSPSALSAS